MLFDHLDDLSNAKALSQLDDLAHTRVFESSYGGRRSDWLRRRCEVLEWLDQPEKVTIRALLK